MHGKWLLPMTGSETISSSVATSDNDDAFAGRHDLSLRLISLRGISFRITGIPEAAPVLLRQVVHCEMDSFQLASRDIEIARMLRSSGEHDGIELLPQVFDLDILAHLRTGEKFH